MKLQLTDTEVDRIVSLIKRVRSKSAEDFILLGKVLEQKHKDMMKEIPGGQEKPD